MLKPSLHLTENERIATLRDLLILDTAPEKRFDVVTAYAASLFNVRICLVTLVDTHRQWFKSHHGIGVQEVPREVGFCSHAILQDDILEIFDARNDARVFDSPLVTSAPFIRFYAGYPLTMENGQHVGTLCLIDPQPKRLCEWEREHLAILGRMVEAELQGLPTGSLQQFIDSRKGVVSTNGMDLSSRAYA
ncbi:GAF domain-containing protein [Dechloromonas sp. XY25]|uniref:GAF domain-containing protein n=1 Tax=Dechloromonas hankyongensis TaxID=2908002 RepID=A0ABS9JZT2_9RHOO|nr:GAF domain-containing protein [Dechloromonas hankyongensis]MCG2576423.1 GAF domain-containing protein [Dechloromonas hankyongensis]